MESKALDALINEVAQRVAEMRYPRKATAPMEAWLDNPGDVLVYYSDLGVIGVLDSHGRTLNEIFKP